MSKFVDIRGIINDAYRKECELVIINCYDTIEGSWNVFEFHLYGNAHVCVDMMNNVKYTMHNETNKTISEQSMLFHQFTKKSNFFKVECIRLGNTISNYEFELEVGKWAW